LFNRHRCGFGTITHLELLGDVVDVIAYCVFADAKGIADFKAKLN